MKRNSSRDVWLMTGSGIQISNLGAACEMGQFSNPGLRCGSHCD